MLAARRKEDLGIQVMLFWASCIL